MFNFYNKSDEDVRKDVVNELLWDPSISDSQIKVTASNGMVTLRGSVPHYIEKKVAERAAQRVGGVKAVADELTVKGAFDKTDEEIARAGISALKWNYSVPENVKLAVANGWITLSGETEWEYQRKAAENAVSKLIGVVGFTNSITLKPKFLASDVRTQIEQALKRSAESEGKQITIVVKEDAVTLSGNIHSFSEMEDIRRAAWNAPGVKAVINNMLISK